MKQFTNIRYVLSIFLLFLCKTSSAQSFTLLLKNSENCNVNFSVYYYTSSKPNAATMHVMVKANSVGKIKIDIREKPHGDYIDVTAIGEPSDNEQRNIIFIMSNWLKLYKMMNTGYEIFSCPLVTNYLFRGQPVNYKIDFTDYIIATSLEYRKSDNGSKLLRF